MYLFASSSDGSDALLSMLRDAFDAADGSRYEVPLQVTSSDLSIVDAPETASLTDDGKGADIEFWCSLPRELTATSAPSPAPAVRVAAPNAAPPASGHETALVLLLEGELGERVQAIRSQLDENHVDRWPAHITLCYPFVPAAALASVLPSLAPVCAGTPPLNLTFKTFGHFNHGARRGCVTWLRPEPEKAIRALHASLANALQPLGVDCPRLSQPHCTVARGQKEPQGKALAALWPAQTARIAKVVVLQRQGPARNSPMRAVATLPLGPDGGEAIFAPAAALAPAGDAAVPPADAREPARAGLAAAPAAPEPRCAPTWAIDVALKGDTAGTRLQRTASVRHVEATGGNALALKLAYAAHRIHALSENVSKVTQAAVEEVQGILHAAGRVFGQRGVTRQRRGELLMQRKDLQARLDQLHALVEAKARRDVTRDDALVSRMSDLRFKGQLHARRARALQRRAAGNAGKDRALAVLNSLPPYSRGAAGALQGGDEARAFYACTMTCADVEELMGDGPDQVLGFGLAVRRPEAVVDSPTLIHVDRVTSTFLARDAFLDAIEFKLPEVTADADPGEDGASAAAASSVHGGFDMRPPELAHATVGRCREPINAWLPLYVCEQHWQRARALLPATLGYLCCLDPLAFHEYQYDVPLVVLGSLAAATARRSASLGQHDARLFFAVQRMVRAAVVDAGRLEDHVHERLRQFVADPNARLKHNLSSLLTILGALLVADPSVAEAVIRGGFFTHVRHEALRRAAGTLLRERSPSACAGLVDQLLFAHNGGEALDDASVNAMLSSIGRDGAGAGAGADSEGAVNSDKPMDPHARYAMQADAALPLALAPKHRRAMTHVGLHLRKALPGPNIEKKAKAAKQEAKAWWESRLEAARELVAAQTAGADGGAPAGASAQLDSTQAKTLTSVVGQLLQHTFPTFGQITAVQRVATAWLDVACEPGANQGFFDALAPASACEHLKRVLATERGRPAGRCAGELCLDAFQSRWQRLRAAVIQSVEMHSNSTARRAAQPGGEFVEGTDANFEARAAEMAERRRHNADADAREARAVELRRQMAVQQLLVEDDLDLFVALLNAVTGGQRDGVYKELYDLMLAHPESVAALAPKLKVMLVGRMGDHSVFARGNSAVPTGAQAEALKRALGEEAYANLRIEIFGNVAVHVYRESDIPNRHGNCNSSPHMPWQCDLCMANGNWTLKD